MGYVSGGVNRGRYQVGAEYGAPQLVGVGSPELKSINCKKKLEGGVR